MWQQISVEEKEITKEFLDLLMGGVDEKTAIEERKYLVTHVIPTLVPGLIKLLRATEINTEKIAQGKKVKPIKATDFLAKYLYRHNPRYANTPEVNELQELAQSTV